MNEDPPGIQVNASSPYKTVKELADAIKAAPPGKMKASGTGQGGIWHLALVGWMKAMGLARQSGRLGAVERRRAGDAGSRGRRPRPLHLLGAGSARHHRGRQGAQPRRHGAGAQPGLQGRADAEGGDGHRLRDRRLARHRGPEGPAADIATKLTAALKKVYDSKEFKDFMSNRGFGTVWGDAAEFASFMDKGDAQMGDAMKAAGLAKA